MTPIENTKGNRPEKFRNIRPLTLQELNEDMNKRVEAITNEFRAGFQFIQDYEKSVTFFGSARTMPEEFDYKKAYGLAKRIVTELGYAIVTGGGPGIMGAANCGTADGSGTSVGLTIQLPAEQVTNPCINHHMDFYYFFSRKVCLSFSAEAYVFFPGGFGTLDELFEILTLVQTNKIQSVPVILVGSHFWNDLDVFIKNQMLKTEKISPEDMDLYTITDDENVILDIIKKAPIRIKD